MHILEVQDLVIQFVKDIGKEYMILPDKYEGKQWPGWENCYTTTFITCDDKKIIVSEPKLASERDDFCSGLQKGWVGPLVNYLQDRVKLKVLDGRKDPEANCRWIDVGQYLYNKMMVGIDYDNVYLISKVKQHNRTVPMQ